ncbi:MAG: glycosyltransferase family 4 protein [Flavobacteriales bacterium]
MKRILVNIYKIKELYSGLGQFSINFANELCKQLPEDWSVDFLVPQGSDIHFDHPSIRTVKSNFVRRHLPFLNEKYNLWHNLYQTSDFQPNKNTPLLMTVHDLNFLYEKSGWKANQYLRKIQKAVNRADYLSAISDFAISDIKSHININNKSIHRIYNGIDFGEMVQSVKPEFIDDKQAFFFTIGYLTPKKNSHVLIPLLTSLKDYKLIIAGNNQSKYAQNIQKEIDKLKLNNRVFMVGNVSEEQKKWLYENCSAFLFPSLAEGFGMPVIEAMHHGKPVFLSKCTSLPEIGGDLAFYFDNFEPKHMIKAVKEGLQHYKSNENEWSSKIKIHADNFSWERCIKQYLQLYSEIIKD